MAWFPFMLLMKNELLNIAYSLIQDIEDASPNLKNNLSAIYPIRFKLDLVGHRDIYCSLDQDKKNITFNEIENIDFEIRTSIKESIDILISKKLNRKMTNVLSHHFQNYYT